MYQTHPLENIFKSPTAENLYIVWNMDIKITPTNTILIPFTKSFSS